MARDIQDRVGQLLGSDSARALAGTAVTELLKGVGGKNDSGGENGRNGGGGHSPRALSGIRGLAAGAGAAALAPAAAKGIGKLVKGNGIGSLSDAPKNLTEGAVSKLGDTVQGKVKEKVDEAGGASGILKDTVKSALPFGGGSDSKAKGKQDAQGVGKGRRMPVQQSIDIGLPVETVYNQWTQFEEWPKFMHRVRRASQEDPCKVAFTVKIWGRTKEFTADIETQRPDDRIKWKTSQGMNVSGVVAFRELGPNLTRVQVSFDVDPGSLLEKYARGTRYIKRAARADLHRFAAFILMLENETGAWRGVIEDGELVEDHDPSYDESREYGDAEELLEGSGDDDDSEDDEEESDEDDEEESDERPQRRSRGRNGGDPDKRRTRSAGRGQASAGRSGSSSGRGGAQAASRSSSSRSTSRRSSSGRSSSGGSSGGGSSSGRSSSGGSSSGRSSSGRSSSARSASGRASGGRGSSGRTSSGRSSSARSSGSSSSGRSSGRSSSGRSSGSSRSRASSSSSGSSAGGRKRSRTSGRS